MRPTPTAVEIPGAFILDNATLAEIAEMTAVHALPIAIAAWWVAGLIAYPLHPIKVITTLLVGIAMGVCAESVLILESQAQGVGDDVVIALGYTVAAAPVIAVVARAALQVAHSAPRVRELRQRQADAARTSE